MDYTNLIHASTMADHMCKCINDRADRLKDMLAEGNVTSLEDYKYISGEIRGLNYSLDEIKSIMKGVEIEDE